MAFMKTYKLPDKSDDILLIGEILIDVIEPDKFNKHKKLFGGSPANISVNLRNLGVNPHFFGAVGNDDSGIFLKNELDLMGIDNRFVKTFKTNTTTVEIRSNDDSPVPSFKRAADYHIYYTKELEAELSKVKIIHFSYWPLSKEPAKSTIKKVIDYANKNNIIIGFDPNYHEGLETNESISIEELKVIMGQTDIIKPSLDDSKRIFGEGYTVRQYLSKYQDIGCKLIVMTLGKDGVIASYEDEVIELKTLATEIVDVTGAGDAFWSGLYAGLLNDETIYNAIKLGLACSTYSLKEIGAITNLPKLKQIKKAFKI